MKVKVEDLVTKVVTHKEIPVENVEQLEAYLRRGMAGLPAALHILRVTDGVEIRTFDGDRLLARYTVAV
jgi:hypothetical protein